MIYGIAVVIIFIIIFIAYMLKEEKIIKSNVLYGIIVLVSIFSFLFFTAVDRNILSSWDTNISLKETNQADSLSKYVSGDLRSDYLLRWQKATHYEKMKTCKGILRFAHRNKMLFNNIQELLKNPGLLKHYANELMKAIDRFSVPLKDKQANIKKYKQQSISGTAIAIMLTSKWMKSQNTISR